MSIVSHGAATYGVDCVCLSRCDRNFEIFSGLLNRAGIAMKQARTLEEADFLLIVTEAVVLVVESMFPDGTWKDAARMLASAHPSVGLIVITEPMAVAPDAMVLPVRLRRFVSTPLRFGDLPQAIRSAYAGAEDSAARRRVPCSLYGGSGGL